jgi:hypothetical protein
MDPIDLQKRITAKTTGVIVVHMSGSPQTWFLSLPLVAEMRADAGGDNCSAGVSDGRPDPNRAIGWRDLSRRSRRASP